MIARLHVQLPFIVAVPNAVEFSLHPYQDEGYRVCVYPPVRSPECTAGDDVDVRMGGRQSSFCDQLRIDFVCGSFSRGPTDIDPPMTVIQRAVDSFVARLRHVGNAPQARPVPWPMATWHLEYLDDSGHELERDESLVRGRGGRTRSVSYVGLSEAVWEDIHALEPEFEPLAWEELLLEAQFELPRIGPSIVLSATALEVLISSSLQSLAGVSASAPLWQWVDNRSDFLKRPTVEEQFDSLLEIFTGHSLESDHELWQLFMNLKKARNAFVHTGVAVIGREQVSIEKAAELVQGAVRIADQVRAWLPEDYRWPTSRHDLKLETTMWPFGRPELQPSADDGANGETTEI